MQPLEGLLQRCQRQVDTLGLFSPNEQTEDIATGDLKYLLIDCLLGDLLSRTDERDPLLRKELLKSCLQAYSRYAFQSSLAILHQHYEMNVLLCLSESSGVLY